MLCAGHFWFDTPARCFGVKEFRMRLSQLSVMAGRHREQRTSVPCTDRRAPSVHVWDNRELRSVQPNQDQPWRPESVSVGGPTDVHLLSSPINSLASCSQRKKGRQGQERRCVGGQLNNSADILVSQWVREPVTVGKPQHIAGIYLSV